MQTLDTIQQLTRDVQYKDWTFRVLDKVDGYLLQVLFTDEGNEQSGRKWYVSPHMTDSEVVLTCLKAVLTAEEHEAREQFRYRNARIFGPHLDVEFLAREARKLDNLDLRDEVA